MSARLCMFPDCGRDHWALNLCRAHWQQWHQRGELWPIGARVNRAGSKKRIGTHDEIVIEVENMLGTDDVDGIATRLGYGNRRSLYAALRRADRLDLWQRIPRVVAA